jgi:hypothetical protein
MTFAVVLGIMMAVLLGVTFWLAVTDTTDDETGPAKDSVPAPEEAKPETLEGVLVRQLLADEINKAQYRRALQRLAERDADRHPMTVPTEN